MYTPKQFLSEIWSKTPDYLKRPIHTFWQTFLAVFGLGVTGILSNLLSTHNFTDAKSALLALTTAAVAAGFATVKSLYFAKQG